MVGIPADQYVGLLKDAPELWKFIKVCFSQKLSDTSNRLRGCLAGINSDGHGPIFVNMDDLVPSPHTALAHKNRPPIIKFCGNIDEIIEICDNIISNKGDADSDEINIRLNKLIECYEEALAESNERIEKLEELNKDLTSKVVNLRKRNKKSTITRNEKF